MSISSPVSIKYKDMTVGGGSSTYQLHGPYVIQKNFDEMRLVFDVIVVAADGDALYSAADTLESTFAGRLDHGETLTITWFGSSWEYTTGDTALGATAELTKSGNPDTDRGNSRAYTLTVEAQLPADGDGLKDLETLVDYDVGRRATVSMRGLYTATPDGHALSRYEESFDSKAQALLKLVKGDATWELADETNTIDRHFANGQPYPYTCQFTRQYTELLSDQAIGTRDDESIKGHRVTFTDLSQHPGDAREDTARLRRVVVSYDCALDIDKTDDLKRTFDDKVKPLLLKIFEDAFSPQVFAVEERRVSFDETSKRMSGSVQFVYQGQDGGQVVELSQSVAFREARSIDYTPVFDEDELAAIADVGWADVERVWSRTVVVIGDESPKLRIAESPREFDAGPFGSIAGHDGPDGNTTTINDEGWNVIRNISNVSDQWLGDPLDDRIKLSILTENVTERYHRKPGGGTSVPLQQAPGS